MSGAEVTVLWSQRWIKIKWVSVSQRSLIQWNIMRLCRPARDRKWRFSLQIAAIYSHKQHTRIRCWNIALYLSRPVFLIFSPLMKLYKLWSDFQQTQRLTWVSKWQMNGRYISFESVGGRIEWYYMSLTSSELHLLCTTEMMSHLARYCTGHSSPQILNYVPTHTCTQINTKKLLMVWVCSASAVWCGLFNLMWNKMWFFRPFPRFLLR